MTKNFKIYCLTNGRVPDLQELDGYPYDETLIIVPSQQLKTDFLKYNIGECLLFDEFVNKLLGLNSQVHPHEITGKAKVLTVDAVISKYPSKYFEALCRKKGFINYVSRLFSYFGASALSYAELRAVMLDENSWSEKVLSKNKEIMELYSSYLEKLDQNSWYDKEKKYTLLIEEIQNQQDNLDFPYQKVVFLGFDSFTNQQLLLMKQFSQYAEIMLFLDYDKKRREQLFSPTEKIIATLEDDAEVSTIQGASSGKEDLDFLADSYGCFLPDGHKEKAENIFLNSFVNSEEELRWIMAEIKARLLEGASCSDFAIFLGNSDKITRMRLIADEYGIPVTVPRKTSLLSHPLANLILKFVQCAKSGSVEAANALFYILTSVFMQTFTDESGYDVNLLADIHNEYYYADIEGISKLLEIYDEKSYSRNKIVEDTYVKHCLVAADDLRALLNEDSTVTLSEYLLAIENFLKGLDIQKKVSRLYAHGKLELDNIRQTMTVMQKLHKAIGEIRTAYAACAMSDISLSAEEMEHVLLESFAKESIVLAKGFDSGVAVLPPGTYTGKSYKHVYICGVCEREYPLSRREGWLYTDAECQELDSKGVYISGRLKESERENLGFYRSCAIAMETLNISWFREEGAKGDTEADSGASSFINKVRALFGNLNCCPRNHYTDRFTDSHLHFASPEEVLALGVKAQASIREIGQVDDRLYGIMNVDKVRHQENSYYNGNLGYRIRYMYDNYVPGKIAYYRFKDRFSAKQLGLMGICPFRFFVQEICGLKGIRNIYTDSGIDEEKLLHKTIEEFFTSHKGIKLSNMEFAELEKELRTCFESRCQRLEADNKVQTGDIWNLQKMRMWTCLYRMLTFLYEEDSQQENYEISLSPWRFGEEKTRVNVTVNDNYAPDIEGSIDLMLADKKAEPMKLILNKFALKNVPAENNFSFGQDQEMYAYILALRKRYGNRINLAAASWYSLEEGERVSNVPLDKDLADTLVKKGIFNFATNDYRCRNAKSIQDRFDRVSAFAEEKLKDTIEAIRKSSFMTKKSFCDFSSCPFKEICRKDIAKE